MNRLELTGHTRRYQKIGYSAEAIDRLLTDLSIESRATAPEQIVLDLDATGIALHGHQPERFFHRGPHGQVFVCGVEGTDAPVRLPAVNRGDEGKSTPAVLLRAGLHADGGAAPAGPERRRKGRGARGYDPPEALKIGAFVRISVRRVPLRLSSACPWKEIYAQAYRALRC